ncbi:hypothetical protein KSE_19135 [Kitasatospora setae KM-6054]|uniref:Uncharacterized protein n=1 Tax=Kitasatospora setae (strain ATCC 33774 / DSM 43861 / JCM 3304 / KCC A-0304 / NBRC 14216 / KM-6054) TaxID=452652 RepID=E4N957_KITSK|nr:hypothetical protein KSE_19135 [Kitasatospora setae KM-6054]
MSAQPHQHADIRPEIPRTPDGIAAALLPSRRMRFRVELGGTATGEAFERLLEVWWCRATLDQRGGREARSAAARAGTLPLGSWDSLRSRREKREG